MGARSCGRSGVPAKHGQIRQWSTLVTVYIRTYRPGLARGARRAGRVLIICAHAQIDSPN